MVYKKEYSIHFLRKILLLLIVLVTSIILMQNISVIHTYALINETDDDHEGVGVLIANGVSKNKSGFLIYLASRDGELKSEVIAAFPKNSPPGGIIVSRIGQQRPSKICTNVPWSPDTPYDESGNANGGKIRQWFINKGSESLAELEKTFGLDVSKVKSGEDLVIIEQISWCALRSGGPHFCGTTWSWGKELLSEFGPGLAPITFRRYHNGVYADCMKFSIDRCGINAVSGHDYDKYFSNAVLAERTNALGIMSIELQNNSIHTYWEPYGSPGEPEPNKPNKVGEYNIYKIYHTYEYENGTLIRDTENDAVHSTTSCVPSISVDDEPYEYRLEYWTTSPNTGNPTSATSVKNFTGPQTGTQEKLITLKQPAEKSVYLVLVRDTNEKIIEDYNYLLTQSMITRTVWENYPDIEDGMEFLKDQEFTWTSKAHPTQCKGHTCSVDQGHSGCDSGCTSSHPCGEEGNCTSPTWDEHKIMFSIFNEQKEDFPLILATKPGWNAETFNNSTNAKRWEPKGSWGYGERQNKEKTSESKYETSKKEAWDYVFVLMRGADKLTIAEWANNGEAAVKKTTAITDLHDASPSEGLFKVGNTNQGDRKTSDYYEKFSMNFVQDPSGDYSTQVKYSTQWSHCDVSHGPCYNEQEYGLNTTMSTNIIVRIEVYSGNPVGGKLDTSVNDDEKITGLPGTPGFASGKSPGSGKELVVSGKMIQAETASFLPYILMKYQTRDSGYQGYNDTLHESVAGWYPAYVLGIHERSIQTNDYAEITWGKTKNNPNMQLTSSQWSTHALATQAWGTNNVLPGGATLGLSIKNDNRQHVFVTTYYTMTTGLGRKQCELTGGDPTQMDVEESHSRHESYAESVRNALDKTMVQQWQNSNPTESAAWKGRNGQPVNRYESNSDIQGWYIDGLDVSGEVTSSDKKYYFDTESAEIPASNQGDYDAKIIKSYWKAYTFYSDVAGNIYITDTTNNPGIFREGDNDASGMRDSLNARTGVYDKLEAAVEQSILGDSEDCDDIYALTNTGTGFWYNEAFDGITVIVEETEIEVGFVDPGERSQILDPKLTITQDSKGNQYGMNEKDANKRKTNYYQLGQFKTRTYSEHYGIDEFETVGEFGNYTTDTAYVKQDQLDFLFWTRKFWIPNFTVQDIY